MDSWIQSGGVLPVTNSDMTFGHNSTKRYWQWQLIPVRTPPNYNQTPRKRPLTEVWKEQNVNCERRINLKKSRASSIRLQNRLKRLERVHMWKLDRKQRQAVQTERLEAKQERRRGKKCRPLSSENCPLWNCPRKKMKRGMKGCRSRRSIKSCLSNLSTRSRTPIQIRCPSHMGSF